MIAWVIVLTRVKFKNWGWKPKIVRVFDSSEIYKVHCAIDEGRISSKANRFILEKGFLLQSKDNYKILSERNPITYDNNFSLTRNYYHRIWDKRNLKKLLMLLEMSEGSSIKTTSFIISFISKQNKASTLVSNAKMHSFTFIEKKYRIESTNSQTYLRGSISDLNDSQGSMMIKWDEFRSLDATITSEDSTSDPRSDLCESLSNIDAFDKINSQILFEYLFDNDANGKTDINILFKKSDITKFILCNLKDLQEAWNYPNASIHFTYPIENFSLEENICALESTPKYFTIDIVWKENLKSLIDGQLWKSLIKFRFVKLYNKSIGSILIDREGQNLIFNANIRKNKTKISLANKGTSKTISEIISLLFKIYRQYGY